MVSSGILNRRPTGALRNVTCSSFGHETGPFIRFPPLPSLFHCWLFYFISSYIGSWTGETDTGVSWKLPTGKTRNFSNPGSVWCWLSPMTCALPLPLSEQRRNCCPVKRKGPDRRNMPKISGMHRTICFLWLTHWWISICLIQDRHGRIFPSFVWKPCSGRLPTITCRSFKRKDCNCWPGIPAWTLLSVVTRDIYSRLWTICFPTLWNLPGKDMSDWKRHSTSANCVSKCRTREREWMMRSRNGYSMRSKGLIMPAAFQVSDLALPSFPGLFPSWAVPSGWRVTRGKAVVLGYLFPFPLPTVVPWRRSYNLRLIIKRKDCVFSFLTMTRDSFPQHVRCSGETGLNVTVIPISGRWLQNCGMRIMTRCWRISACLAWTGSGCWSCCVHPIWKGPEQFRS